MVPLQYFLLHSQQSTGFLCALINSLDQQKKKKEKEKPKIKQKHKENLINFGFP